MTEPSLQELEQQRAELLARLAATGDVRPGSINVTYRRCGKPNCACAQPGHPGHGPRWLWTRPAAGPTRPRQRSPAAPAEVPAHLAASTAHAAHSERIAPASGA